jgi:phosphoglycolate phosphatase-like HAD superfamily hydrolase
MMQEIGIANVQQVIKIGDTEVDVQEGKNAGCLYSIAVTTRAFTRKELLPYEPSFIINDMQELLSIIETLV